MDNLIEVPIYRKQKKFYRSAYEENYTPWSQGKPDRYVDGFLKQLARSKKIGRVLDLGCGDGRHSKRIAQLGGNSVGIDYQFLALERARNGTPKPHQRKILYVYGDVFNLPLQREAFDLVIDYGVFHHIRRKDTLPFIDLILQMLRPGGHFILSCFSTHFKHHDKEQRTRNFLVHHNHYDRFSTKSELRKIFSPDFRILNIQEERNGNDGFFHLLMQKTRIQS